MADYTVDESSLDLNTVLSNSGLTVKRALDIISTHCEEFRQAAIGRKIVEMSARDISADKGYLSRVFKTKVRFAPTTTGIDVAKTGFEWIMKIPTFELLNELTKDRTNSETTAPEDMLYRLHNREIFAYEIMKDLDASFPRPKIFYTELAKSLEEPGMIVMEDKSVNAQTLGIFYSATKEQCMAIAHHVADFQAYADFCSTSWRGRCDNFFFTESLRDLFTTWFDAAVTCEHEEVRAVAERWTRMDFVALTQYASMDCAAGKEKLCHGDMWTNNMLIHIAPDGSVTNKIAAFLDYQTLFEGNPLSDIARFISNCVDGAERRDIERKAVDAYYDRLSEAYAAKGAKLQFTREEAHHFYERAFAQQIFILMVMVTIIGVPALESDDGAERARGEKLKLRLKHAAEDASLLLEKHQLESRFAQNKTK